MLLAAAIIPLFTAFNRINPDTAYGAAPPSPLPQQHQSAALSDVLVNQGGAIVKMDASVADVPPRRGIISYTMQPGDTIQNLAAQYGLTVDTLRWANNILDVTAVHPGAQILVPPVNGVLVKITPGMQLNALAVQYHADRQSIIDFNYLRDPDHLVAGSLLMLPDGLGPSLDPVSNRVVTWRRLGTLVQTVTYYGSVSGSGGKFPYGFCTWWVAHKRYVPWSGDAWQWWYEARLYGFSEGQAPQAGAIMVQGISWASPVGHVAYVESVNADGSFTVSEMNYGRWGVVDYRTIRSTAGLDILGFIY